MCIRDRVSTDCLFGGIDFSFSALQFSANSKRQGKVRFHVQRSSVVGVVVAASVALRAGAV